MSPMYNQEVTTTRLAPHSGIAHGNSVLVRERRTATGRV
jgi:hypothetical protein